MAVDGGNRAQASTPPALMNLGERFPRVAPKPCGQPLGWADGFDLSRLGNGERNSAKQKAREGSNERERASPSRWILAMQFYWDVVLGGF